MISSNGKTIGKAGFPLCTIFVVSAISIFFNPYEIFGSTYTNIIIIVIYLACLLYSLFVTKSSMSKYQIGLFILLSIILFLNFRNATIMAFVGLMSLTLALKKEVFFPIFLVDLLYSFVSLYFIYDFIRNGNLVPLGDGRYLLPGYSDPNFSSYILLLYFLLCVKIKSLLGISFAIYIGFLSLSRAYFLSILLFFILSTGTLFFSKSLFLNKVFRKFGKILFFLPDRKRLMLFYVVLFANLLLFAYGSTLAWSLGKNNATILFDPARLYTVHGQDQDRFITNQAYMQYFQKNPKDLLWGNANFSVDTAETGGITIAHNGLISSIILLGFPFSIIYLMVLSSILFRLDFYSNLAFAISPFVFSLFLHTGFSINQNIFIFCVISMANNPRKQFWLRSIPFASFIFSLLPRRSQAT
jgi:hypothetical protein